MVTPTRATTEQDIIDADIERVESAKWAALCELYADLLNVRDFEGFAKWTNAVNQRAMEIFSRLQ